MKDLFDYMRKRDAKGELFLNSEGKKFFGEVHVIFNDGKVVHTRDWQMNDVAMVVEKKKV